ncbi:nucleotide sugar dehydrogenase [Salipiger pacificus]|nr:nucleotide sugar dehydrogenase [Alloyangia pacifica]MCA0948265.1 nucleotide sugar dehydrogenase [Alloyangia pacifica]
MARISVFGIGYVGVVAAACLAKAGHQVVAVDVDQARIDVINAGKSPIVEKGLAALVAETVDSGRLSATGSVTEAISGTEASFVCVGTPSGADGAVGLIYIEQVCKAIGAALAEKDGFHSVILRSTIVPGTCEGTCIPLLEKYSGKTAGEDFGVGYYPEFLRESTAIEDYHDPGLIVFGSLDAHTEALLREINMGMDCTVHSVDLRTAEMAKYTSNAWRAVKVSFANEIGNISKSCGLDGQTVMEILCSDHKVAISPYFMRPGFAFGGSCLPKDIRALRHLAMTNGVTTPVLAAVEEANAEQIARAETLVTEAKARRVGMIGVSFKAGTDDLRESPLAELAARLIRSGVSVEIYDPFVFEAFAAGNATAGRGNATVPDLEARLVGSLEVLLERSDAIVVGNLYKEALPSLARAAGRTPMIDLTRLDRSLVSGGGYSGICW